MKSIDCNIIVSGVNNSNNVKFHDQERARINRNTNERDKNIKVLSNGPNPR